MENHSNHALATTACENCTFQKNENCTLFPRKQWLIQLFALQTSQTFVSTMDNVHRMSTAVCVTN